MAKPLTASQKAAVAAEKARQAAAAAKKNKPKPTPSAGRRVNPTAAKPKPAAKPATPKPPAKPTAKPAARLALPPGRPGGALAGGALALRPRALGSRVAVPLAIGAQLADIKGGFERMAKSPFIQKMGKGGKPAPSAGRRTNPKAAKPAKPKPNMDRPGLRYEKAYDTRAPRSAYGLKPKPSSGTTRASAPSRSTAPARTPSRSTAPARPAASASRPTAAPSRATSSAPKPPSTPSAPKAPKMPAAQSSFGPVKSGKEYGRMIGAPKAPSSSSSSAPATKKKSSALSQAEIRKRRVNR